MKKFLNLKYPVFQMNINVYWNYRYGIETSDPFNLNTRIPEYRKENPNSNDSNVKAWNSEYYTKGFDDVSDELIHVSEKMLYNHYRLYSLIRPYNIWVMEYEENDYAVSHSHYPAKWSGVYYINCGDNPAPLVIEDQVTIKPVDGLYVLFPGDAYHYVPPTKSFRRAMALNFKQYSLDHDGTERLSV